LDRQPASLGACRRHTRLPAEFVRIRFVDPAPGAIVSRGVPGKQCTHDYSVMQGHWNNPEAPTQAIDAARWMHTGDLATQEIAAPELGPPLDPAATG
jgi:acyl-CoA synthetase (AMP-forming)/AMP-acid ligase II